MGRVQEVCPCFQRGQDTATSRKQKSCRSCRYCPRCEHLHRNASRPQRAHQQGKRSKSNRNTGNNQSGSGGGCSSAPTTEHKSKDKQPWWPQTPEFAARLRSTSFSTTPTFSGCGPLSFGAFSFGELPVVGQPSSTDSTPVVGPGKRPWSPQTDSFAAMMEIHFRTHASSGGPLLPSAFPVVGQSTETRFQQARIATPIKGATQTPASAVSIDK